MEHFDFLSRILNHLEGKQERRAFYISEKSYTYGGLGSLIARIQSLFMSEADEVDHVGVYLADDIQTYATILALWMSGKSFIPINPLFPSSRNRNIMEQLDLKLLLHSKDLDPELKELGCVSVFTGELSFDTFALPRLETFDREKDAYVLFTSGSTGTPKGVRISFNNLNAFVRDFILYPTYAFTPEDRFLQIYDLSFDASVHCYTVPLTVGASVYTVPPDGIKYLAAYKLMEEQRLTFVKMPPSTLSYLRPYFSSFRLPDLKYCLFGGEAFPAGLAAEFEGCVPNALIQNVYGPTEVTVNCLIYDWNNPEGKRKELNGIASIGRGFGSNLILVDESGELLVAGEQVSPGYWKNSSQDEKAFRLVESEGKMLRYYCTGDVVSMDDEGELMFVGRNDDQVQVRGYRVELGEVESLARSFLGANNVMACGIEERAGEMQICLAVESEEPDLALLREHLGKALPSYMIPGKIVPIPHFPTLVSGKLDRKAIKELLSR